MCEKCPQPDSLCPVDDPVCYLSWVVLPIVAGSGARGAAMSHEVFFLFDLAEGVPTRGGTGISGSRLTSCCGSPLIASLMFPPSSRAISARRRFETAERGLAKVMSSLEAKASRCLMRSQAGFPEVCENAPRARTRAQEPFSFVPRSVNFRSPFLRLASTSESSGTHVPLSQIMTVPAPYSPSGTIPSKLAYSIG